MSQNNEAPNFALKGKASAKLGITSITMGGEVSRSLRIMQVEQVPMIVWVSFSLFSDGHQVVSCQLAVKKKN
jgi:hypothetical protein